MIGKQHVRRLRLLWLAVFYALALTLAGLAVFDWQRYAAVIEALGLVLLTSTGSIWILLFPPSAPTHKVHR